MIQILPVPPHLLPGFCREKGIQSSAPLRGYTACQGDVSLGWCVVSEGEPCLVLGVEAEDGLLADGLLRAALFPLYEGGAEGYAFRKEPAIPLPERYVTTGEGKLSELFAPCRQKEEKE